MNAISMDMLGGLMAALDAIADRKSEVRCVVMTGTGRAFCTGADVNAIPEDGKVIYERPYLSTHDQWEAPQEGTPPFRTMAKPVLTAVNPVPERIPSALVTEPALLKVIVSDSVWMAVLRSRTLTPENG